MKRISQQVIRVIAIAGILLLAGGQLGINCNKKKSDVGAIFRTTDAGLSYEPVINIAGKNQKLGDVNTTDIATFPGDSSVIYLATKGNGFLRSIDGGSSWTSLTDENKQMNTAAQIFDIEFDPSNPNILYAAGFQEEHGHVFKSMNKGQSWTKSYVIPNQSFAVYAVKIDPINPQNIYIGTAEGGVLRSADAGTSWQLQKKLDGPVVDLAINPQQPGTIVAATYEKGIFQTIDGGATWEMIGKDTLKKLQGSYNVEHVIIDPNNPKTIYITSKFGIVRSDDNGATFQALDIIPQQTQGVTALVIQKGNSNTLYYGSGSVMYKSTDRGVNWTVRDLPTNQEVAAIAIDSTNPNIVFVGTRAQTQAKSAI